MPEGDFSLYFIGEETTQGKLGNMPTVLPLIHSEAQVEPAVLVAHFLRPKK